MSATPKTYADLMGDLVERLLAPPRPRPRRLVTRTDTFVHPSEEWNGVDYELEYRATWEDDDAPQVEILKVTLVSTDRIEIPLRNLRTRDLQYIADQIADELEDEREKEREDARERPDRHDERGNE